MPETGQELIKRIAEEPTLDRLLDRNPSLYSQKDLYRIVEVARRDRVRFNVKKEKRRLKKQGLDMTEEE